MKPRIPGSIHHPFGDRFTRGYEGERVLRVASATPAGAVIVLDSCSFFIEAIVASWIASRKCERDPALRDFCVWLRDGAEDVLDVTNSAEAIADAIRETSVDTRIFPVLPPGMSAFQEAIARVLTTLPVEAVRCEML